MCSTCYSNETGGKVKDRHVGVGRYLHGVDGVSDDTQNIKTGHNGLRQVHVLSKGEGGVIPAACEETSTES